MGKGCPGGQTAHLDLNLGHSWRPMHLHLGVPREVSVHLGSPSIT